MTKRQVMAWGAALMGVSLVAGSLIGTAAGAEPEPPAPTLSSIVQVVDEVAGLPASTSDAGGDDVTSDLVGAAVDVSTDPDVGLTIDPDHGPAVAIGVPGDPADGQVMGGNVVYPEIADQASVVARPTKEGVQALIAIDGPDAPTEFAFPIEVAGRAARLVAAPDGSVDVLDPATDASVSTIKPPWATDAADRAVPTHYRIEGSILVQVVDHRGAAYPVVADPNTCGTWTCTYYFGKAATRDISGAKNAAAGCALLYAVPVAAALCAVGWAAVSVQADRAYARGMCLKIKYTRSFPPVWYPDIYRDRRYCKW